MRGNRSVPLRPRSPAAALPRPEDLALVQAFINTHYDLEVDHGAEVLATPEALAAWLGARELTAMPADASAADLRRALTAREALRDLARANGSGPATDREAVRRLDRAAGGRPSRSALEPTALTSGAALGPCRAQSACSWRSPRGR